MPIYYNVLQFLRGGVKPKYYNITIVFGLQIEGKVRKVLQKSTFFEILKKLFLKTEEFDKKCHSIVMILRKIVILGGVSSFCGKILQYYKF